MENKLTKIMAVLSVVGLMVAGPLAYAESEGDNSESGKGYNRGEGKEFMKDLNLTPEQKATLKAKREAKKESNKAAREQLKAKMQALHETITNPTTKRSDVDGLVSEVNALKGQMFAQMIDGVFAMKEVLTPEQFAKMQAKHKERMDKMSKKHEGWEKRHQKNSASDQAEPEKS